MVIRDDKIIAVIFAKCIQGYTFDWRAFIIGSTGITAPRNDKQREVMDYLSVAQAKHQAGLRLVCSKGTPSPWGLAVRAMLDWAGVDYQLVEQLGGQPNPELLDWTGQASAPVAMLDDERPRHTPESLIFLVDRLSGQNRLLPQSIAARASMFGCIREIAGEQGLGWQVRLISMHAMAAMGIENPVLATIQHRYGFAESTQASAVAGCRQIVDWLNRQLVDSVNGYYLPEGPLAVDFYSAVFTGVMLDPVDDQWIAIPASFRQSFAAIAGLLEGIDSRALLSHRNRMFEQHIVTPLLV